MFHQQVLLLKAACVKCGEKGTIESLGAQECMQEPSAVLPAMQSTPTHEGEPQLLEFGKISPVEANISWTTPPKSASTSTVTIGTSPLIPTALQPTLQGSIMRPLDQPPDTMEEQLYTRLTKRKLRLGKEKSVIRCKTGGQVGEFK